MKYIGGQRHAMFCEFIASIIGKPGDIIVHINKELDTI